MRCARDRLPERTRHLARSVTSFERADRLITRGNGFEDKGDFDAALSCYREAVALAPNHPRAHMNTGNALRRLGRMDEALAAQREASLCAPEYAPAHFNVAALLVASGDLAGAEGELREVLRLNPEMSEALVLLADVLE